MAKKKKKKVTIEVDKSISHAVPQSITTTREGKLVEYNHLRRNYRRDSPFITSPPRPRHRRSTLHTVKRTVIVDNFEKNPNRAIKEAMAVSLRETSRGILPRSVVRNRLKCENNKAARRAAYFRSGKSTSYSSNRRKHKCR